jgi:predicted MFS family arabinose efflux permease
VISAALLMLLPEGQARTRTVSKLPITRVLQPALLRIDFYVFLLHTLMTAMFVALPFVLQNTLDWPLAEHWKMYLAALAVSLIGTVPLILADEREGKGWVFGLAIALVTAGLLALVLAVPTPVAVFAALAVFFAGFNFLEAGLPARLSLIAAEESRGAAMGVFSSSQFLGAFAGGLTGGLLLADGGGRVFVACAAIAVLWLIYHLARPAV